jgi:hypothetical protein
MPKSMRKLVFVASFFVLWDFMLSSSSASAAGATICAVVADPSNFDRQAVALDGVVTSLYETTSQRGNDYTTFRLQGANGCCRYDFYLGSPGIDGWFFGPRARLI